MAAAVRRMPDEFVNLEDEVVNNADYFTSIVFMGRGVYDRREYPARAFAEDGAKRHAQDKGKPAMIYAVDPHGRQAFVTAIHPERRNG